MKVLILILSYNSPPYDALMRAQQETFDSVEVDEVRTVYYHGGAFDNDTLKLSLRHSNPRSCWERIEFQCTDSYFLMAEKFKKCLEYVKDWEYDYMFRSNSSSYICKQKLKEFAETLPKEKLYAGWEIKANEGFNIISGAGFFLSRDTADILRTNIDPDFEKEEDYYCAKILHEHGIEIIDDKSRFDVGPVVSGIPTDRYHYRLKNANRLMDAENMKVLHKLIHG